MTFATSNSRGSKYLFVSLKLLTLMLAIAALGSRVVAQSPPSASFVTSTIFQALGAGANVNNLAVGDINGDGIPDIIAVGGSCIAVLLGNGNSAAFEDSRFKDVIPFGFEDENAGWVRLANVDLSHRTWHRHVRFAELFSHRTSDFWSEVEAIRRAKDEVLTVSFDLQAATAREVDISTYLASFKEKTVLVLGDFKSGRDRLSAIKAALARRSYLPIVLDEIVEEPNYDLRQKFQAVAAVCRFCVFDDSTAAGQIAEMSIADPLNIVRIILRMGQQQSTYMTRGTALTSRVVREWEYTLETLDEVVAQAATWAESTVKDLAIGREEAYPWRKQES